MTSKPPTDRAGFTLPELLIATAISLLTATVAGDLLISHIRSSERAEALERQRSDWARTTGFLEAEIALSERVYTPDPESTDPLPVAVPSTCGFTNDQVRLELDLRRDLPPVVYAVRPSSTGWLPHNTLWRCGPGLNSDGSYNTTISVAPIVDGLCDEEKDPNACDGDEVGFNANASDDNKQASFRISLLGHATIAYRQEDVARTRISPLYARPSENSLCDASNLVKLEGSSSTADTLEMSIGQVTAGEDVLICGRGYGTAANGSAGDTITGSDGANDILEGGDYGRATLKGEGGNDVLRGTLEADTLNGGSGDDILVGRDGDDEINGGSEDNSYLPGSGSDTVNGGTGLDVVFFSGPRADYTLSDNCSKTSCTVTASGDSSDDGADTLSGIEILIFKDARVDLPD